MNFVDDLDDEASSFFDDLVQEADSDAEEEALTHTEALALLKNFYVRPTREKKSWEDESLEVLEKFLGEELPELMSLLPLDETLLPHFRQLSSMTAAALEQARLPMLRGKTVIGVGGGFSVGKSRFLNALTGLGQLPENLGPTTAVGTYLLHGAQDSIQAFTRHGHLVDMDEKGLKSITHDFYDLYRIGFADILHKIIITSSLNPIPENIALLDTPGYNKADEEQQNDTFSQDGRIALQHLRGCDYLIWLMAADAGTSTESDINFLKELNVQNPCLVVVNKADMRPEQLPEIVQNLEDTIKKAGILCFGVTAYSSAFKEEWNGNNLIQYFLEEASTTKPHQDCISDLKKIQTLWSNAFEEQKSQLEETLRKIEDDISSSNGASHILGIIKVYKSLKQQLTTLYHNQERFTRSITENQERLKALLLRASHDHRPQRYY